MQSHTVSETGGSFSTSFSLCSTAASRASNCSTSVLRWSYSVHQLAFQIFLLLLQQRLDLNTSISDFTAVCSRSEILLEANGSLVSPCAQEKQAPKTAQMIPLPFPSLNEPSSSEESDFAPVAGSAARLLAQDISSSLPWWTGALGFLSCRVPSSSLPARISRAWLQCSHSTQPPFHPP